MRIFTITLAAICTIFILGSTTHKKQPFPKWTKPEIWRTKLKSGLPEKAVIAALGDPLCKEVRSNGPIWYYQQLPPCVSLRNKSTKDKNRIPTVKRQLESLDYGIVQFTNARSPRNEQETCKPKYVVRDWKEPDWARLKSNPPTNTAPRKKLKPKRKLAKWEKPQLWKRLVINMRDKAAKKILGEPNLEILHRLSYKTWYYADIRNCAELKFRKGLLIEWSEPFWPEVEKSLYTPVKQAKPSKPTKKPQDNDSKNKH